MTREQMISQLTALYGPKLEWGVDDFFIGVVEDIGYEPFSDRGLVEDRAGTGIAGS